MKGRTGNNRSPPWLGENSRLWFRDWLGLRLRRRSQPLLKLGDPPVEKLHIRAQEPQHESEADNGEEQKGFGHGLQL